MAADTGAVHSGKSGSDPGCQAVPQKPCMSTLTQRGFGNRIGGFPCESSKEHRDPERMKIVRAALAIVENSGLDKLNINEIAAKVEMVPAAIY